MKANSDAIDLDLQSLKPQDRYKVLCGVVVPRPIAWVTTINRDGVVNAAPFSFFNVFSEDPPLVVLGLQHYADEQLKDTTRNIHENGEFVVNMCDEALAQAMNNTAVNFPSDISEVQALNLATCPSVDIAPPRLALAPFAFECRREVSLAFGPERELLIGQPIRVHAKAGLLDPERFHINYDLYHPVGRLFGDLYARQRDVFSMTRQTHDQYLASKRGPQE